MKKYSLFIAFLAVFVLIGAGCADLSEDATNEETNNEAEETEMQEEMEEMTLEVGTYNLNLEESTAKWEGTFAIGGGHDGMIEPKEGELTVEDGSIVGGMITIDMTTMTSNEGLDKLVDHLENEDFFAVNEYPEAMFVITSVENGEITGDLTIKDQTHEYSFTPDINTNEEGEITIEAILEIDRTIWDVQYGSDSFFDDLGDKAIDNIFTIEIDLTFEK